MQPMDGDHVLVLVVVLDHRGCDSTQLVAATNDAQNSIGNTRFFLLPTRRLC